MFKSLMKAGSPFEQINMRVINRTDGVVAVGECHAFAIDSDAPTDTGGRLGGGPGIPTGTGTEAAPAPYGLPHNLFANIDAKTNQGADVAQFLCIVTDLLEGSGAAGTEVEVCFQGVCQATATSAAFTIGQVLIPEASSTQLITLAASGGTGITPIAISLSDETTTTPNVLFFGQNAFYSSE